MAIGLVVTRGYGNGTQTGDINLVTTRGYTQAIPPPSTLPKIRVPMRGRMRPAIRVLRITGQ